MKRKIDHRRTNIASSKSLLSFQTTGGGSWEVWDRFIAVDGQNIYHIGNICGTCDFFFEKLGDLKKSVDSKVTVDKLNIGLTSIDEDSLKTFSEIIPSGSYEVLLTTINPKLSIVGQTGDYFIKEQVDLWGIDGYVGGPHSPKANYYRGIDKDIGNDHKLFEFFIPLTSFENLDSIRVDFYKDQISKGIKPTATSLSLLDIKEPAVWPDDDVKPEYTAHWCLAHYIIDGHHKIKAASDLNSEITLLSFLATEKGISNAEDIEKLLEYID